MIYLQGCQVIKSTNLCELMSDMLSLYWCNWLNNIGSVNW